MLALVQAPVLARPAGFAPRPARLGVVVLVLFLFASLADPAAAFGRRSAPPDPSTTGPWAVGHTRFVAVDGRRGDRALPVEVWYPIDAEDAVGTPTYYELLNVLGTSFGLTSEVAIEDAPVTRMPFRPLVLFSHGSGSVNIQSAVLMETLASHGFFVASPNHVGNTTFDGPDDLPFEDRATDRPKDLSFFIDYLLARSSDPGDAFHHAINPFLIGVTGHSFGGFTALAMAAGYGASAFGAVPPDPRVRAIVPVSGVASLFSDDELTGIDVPMLLLGGTLDTVVPIDPNSTRPFDLASSRSVYRVDIHGATHSHFANICDIADVIIGLGIPIGLWPAVGAGALVDPYLETCVPSAYPLEEVVRLQNLYTVAFFKKHLGFDLRYGRYLSEEYAAENEPDVDVFADAGRCGLGFELVLVLPPLLWLRRRAGSRSGEVHVDR
jgi:predicted dienelactone hydrolase